MNRIRVLIPIALLVAAACSNSHHNAAPVPTSADACTKLASCDQCFLDGNGQCLATDACVTRVSTDIAACVAAVSGCDQQALGACLRNTCGGGAGECETG